MLKPAASAAASPKSVAVPRAVAGAGPAASLEATALVTLGTEMSAEAQTAPCQEAT